MLELDVGELITRVGERTDVVWTNRRAGKESS